MCLVYGFGAIGLIRGGAGNCKRLESHDLGPMSDFGMQQFADYVGPDEATWLINGGVFHPIVIQIPCDTCPVNHAGFMNFRIMNSNQDNTNMNLAFIYKPQVSWDFKKGPLRSQFFQ